jgi:hypothetical protein
MAVTALRELDQHSVAVELNVQGQARLVKGTAHYEAQGPLGAALRIEIVDPTGNFELLLREDRWNGQIVSGQPFGCDYAVLLSAPPKPPSKRSKRKK